MGEHFAPTPQKGRGRKRKARPRRKNAAKPAGGMPVKEIQAQPSDAAVQSSDVQPSIDTFAPKVAAKFERLDRSKPLEGWVGRNAYAALDLGTNNCRLLIARMARDGFTIVDAFSRVVRLGEGLASSGRISDEAIERAVVALTICSEKLKRRNVVLSRAVATEACRRAENGAAFVERVQRETGIMLDIISAKEEARLAVLGCQALLDEGAGPAMIFDIGGGSTELVLVSTNNDADPEILDWISVPWGVVSLTESGPIDQSDEPGRIAAYAVMKQRVRDSLADFEARLPTERGDMRLLGTSGTVTTLGSVYLGLQSYDRRAIDGLRVPCADMRGISQNLARLSPEGRTQFPTIGADRADLVVAGCAILETIMDIWPAFQLGVADRGIREGILRGLMESERKRRFRR